MIAKYWFFLLFLVVLCVETKGQDQYAVTGSVYIIDGHVKGTTIRIESAGSSKIQEVPIDNHGHFYAFINWDQQYKFVFSKMGYVSKCIEFSTELPVEVDKETIYPYDLKVELFPVFPDVDTVFYKKAVAIINYNNTIHDFDYDLSYHLMVKNHVEKTSQDYKEWKSASEESMVSEDVFANRKDLNTNHESTYCNPIVSQDTRSYIIQKSESEFPPLEKEYNEGKTVECFSYSNKEVTRVIIQKNHTLRAFYRVKHHWGGVYYFMETQPYMYTSISQTSYQKSTEDSTK